MSNTRGMLSIHEPTLLKKDRRFKHGHIKRTGDELRGDFDIPKRLEVPSGFPDMAMTLNPPIVVDNNLADAIKEAGYV